MKKGKIKIILALVVFFVSTVSAGAEQTSVLEKLLADARQNNPLISASEARVKSAEQAVLEAKGQMGPKIGVAAGASWGEDQITAAVRTPLGTSVLPLGFKDTYVTAVGFVQTVYAGGSLYANRQSKELALDAVKAEKIRTVQSIENAVRLAYYNRRRAAEKELVAEEALALTKQHLARAEKLFKAGVVAKGDVLRTKVAVAEAEMNLIKAQNAAELTISVLERAVGHKIDREMLINDKYIPVDPLFGVVPANISEQAFASRAELKMYSLLSRQAEKVARAAKGQSLPQIVATGGLYAADDDFYPSDRQEVRVAVLAYWKLFDSGVIKAKTAQAHEQANELLFRLEDMKNIVKMEVTQASQNHDSAKARYAVADRRVTEAEEDYRIAVKRYETGVGTNLDMLDARLSLTNSKSDFIDALFDIETANAELIYAVGE